MAKLKNLKVHRSDGHVIDSPVTPENLRALGLQPAKTIAVQWDFDGRTVVYRAAISMLTRLAEGGELVAVIEESGAQGVPAMLSVINGDGSLRLVVPNDQVINGLTQRGEFCWFEPPRRQAPGSVGVVFRISETSSNDIFQLDIDSASGRTLNVYETR